LIGFMQSIHQVSHALNIGAGSLSSGNANSATKFASRRFTSRLARMAGSHCGSTGSASARAAAATKPSSGSGGALPDFGGAAGFRARVFRLVAGAALARGRDLRDLAMLPA
jgi:hypothetical protein